MSAVRLAVLACLVSACVSEEKKSVEIPVALNPLERALVHLRDAYIKEERADLCSADSAIAAECEVCAALGATGTNNLCCADIDEFIQCHIRVLEFFEEMTSLENNAIDPYEQDNEFYVENATGDSDNKVEKRYGTLFSKWNWFKDRKEKSKREKRYGTLFGKFGKRYGTVFGNFGKRYGTVFGGSTFSKNSKRAQEKRYGSLMGKTFSKTKW